MSQTLLADSAVGFPLPGDDSPDSPQQGDPGDGRLSGTSQGLLADLPELRECVEEWARRGLELWPWIDPDRDELPRRPIEEDLDEYLQELRLSQKTGGQIRLILKQTEFFDANDLTAPRIQYCAWKLLHYQSYPLDRIRHCLYSLRGFLEWLRLQKSGRIEENALAGVNLSAWAQGELEHIKRLREEAWEWLRQFEEDEDSPHRLDAIIERAGISLENNPDKGRIRSRFFSRIRDATIIRDGKPAFLFARNRAHLRTTRGPT